MSDQTDQTNQTDEPDRPDELAESEGDDAVHEPGDGNEEPPEPGAGLGDEVEELDPEEES